jgi:ParB-like chromosome segregation protein Spo0J
MVQKSNIEIAFEIASKPTSELAKQISAASKETLKKDRRQGGIKDIATSRNETFQVNPYLLVVKPGWNARDFSDPTNTEHIDDLARSIAKIGVQEPLTAYWDKSAPVLTNGECRLLATFRAIEVYGAEIRSIPVKVEPKGNGEAERLRRQLVGNSGKSFSALETAVVCKRLLDLGWTVQQISENTIKLSVQRVTQLLELHEAPVEIKKMITEGTVASTLALEVLKKSKSEEDAVKTLRKAVSKATAVGKTKATKKHLNGASGASPKTSLNKWFKTALKAASEAGRIDNSGNGTVLVTLELSEKDFEPLRNQYKL